MFNGSRKPQIHQCTPENPEAQKKINFQAKTTATLISSYNAAVSDAARLMLHRRIPHSFVTRAKIHFEVTPEYGSMQASNPKITQEDT
ncbi:hypothetical protein [Sulfitobacter sp.]|jgi:hypothetical protein|uniref:hypothetical protein n=1 Tax=Sulfitobacter sp. TaxID=1903071 RepID=UPI003F6A88BC|tara:strand:+ start:711 stop:974 length:264 start_codon:yes stop_codon:yes gene_type:complete